MQARFREIKPEIRVLGVDDGPFPPRAKGRVLLIGVVCRGGRSVDGVLSTYIEADGMDATDRIIEMITGSRHKGQLRVVMTQGATFAGFNVIDIQQISKRTGLPVIVVSRKRPDFKKVRRAIKNLPEWRKRWAMLRAAGRLYPFELRRGVPSIYLQLTGIELKDAKRVVEMTSIRGLVPEPLRLAHLIATGVVRGESSGGS